MLQGFIIWFVIVLSMVLSGLYGKYLERKELAYTIHCMSLNKTLRRSIVSRITL